MRRLKSKHWVKISYLYIQFLLSVYCFSIYTTLQLSPLSFQPRTQTLSQDSGFRWGRGKMKELLSEVEDDFLIKSLHFLDFPSCIMQPSSLSWTQFNTLYVNGIPQFCLSPSSHSYLHCLYDIHRTYVQPV